MRWYHVETSNSFCPYVPGLYTTAQVDDLINNKGYIPVYNAAEFDKIRTGGLETMGGCTKWGGEYVTGGDKKYIQINAIDFEGWDTQIPSFSGTYDANEMLITIEQSAPLFSCVGNYHLLNFTMTCNSTSTNGCLLDDGSGAFASIMNVSIQGAFESSISLCLIGRNITNTAISGIRFLGSSVITNGQSGNVNGLFGNVTSCYISDIEISEGTTFSAMVNCSAFFSTVADCVIDDCRNYSELIAYTDNGQAAGNCNLTYFANTINTSEITNCHLNVESISIIGNWFRGAWANTFTGEMSHCINDSNIEAVGSALIRIVEAEGYVHNCVNNGNLLSNGSGYHGLFGSVYGLVHDCMQNGDVEGTRNGAGLIGTIGSGGEAYNLIMNGNFTATNDGSGAGNQNGAGLVNHVLSGGVFRNSVMNGDCTMYRQCAGLVRLVDGECHSLRMNGNIVSNSNMGGAIYDVRSGSIVKDILVTSTSLQGSSSAGLFRTIRDGATVSNSLFYGDITGTNARGVCFNIVGAPVVSDVYYDESITAALVGAAGTGQTTSELQTPTSNVGIYANWDDEIWDFGTDAEYPKLINTP